MTIALHRKIFKQHGGVYKDGDWHFPNVTAKRCALIELGKASTAQPMTAAERKAKQRLKLATEGLSEVRGIYAKPEHHERIKKYAAKVK